MNTLVRSSEFDAWLSRLADQKAKARILARLRSATLGNFGDCESVGEGVSEMRIRFGPGYRVYFVRTGTTIYVLLTGGDKSSQQGGQKSWQRGASSPLPLVGRGRGRGSATGPPLCRSLATPTPTLPHKGGGRRSGAPRATCHDFCPSYPSQKQDIARAQKMARELKDTKP